MRKIKFENQSLRAKILSFPAAVFLSNFVFQGVLLMSFGEKVFKITLTLLFSCFFFFQGFPSLLALFFGHTTNYCLNGQFFVAARYFNENSRMDVDKLEKYLKFLERFSKLFKPTDLLFFGSFSRGRMRSSSDLDIRIIHSKTFVSSLRAYCFAFFMRFAGIGQRFPVDVYCYSDFRFLKTIRSDEIPVSLYLAPAVTELFPDVKSLPEALAGLGFDDS